LGYLGIELEESQCAVSAAAISTKASAMAVYVIRIDEELMIARSVCRAIGLDATRKGA
jgi:acetate kinase